MLVASARDTRLMTIYSYTRLIVYDDQFKLHADILESYDAKDGREFTFKLRGGLVYLADLRKSAPDITGVITATRGNHGQSVALARQPQSAADIVAELTSRL